MALSENKPNVQLKVRFSGSRPLRTEQGSRHEFLVLSAGPVTKVGKIFVTFTVASKTEKQVAELYLLKKSLR